MCESYYSQLAVDPVHNVGHFAIFVVLESFFVLSFLVKLLQLVLSFKDSATFLKNSYLRYNPQRNSHSIITAVFEGQ